MKGLAATANRHHHLAQTPWADDAGHPANPADHLLINHRGTILYLLERATSAGWSRGARRSRPTQGLGLVDGLGGVLGVGLADGLGEPLGEALGEAVTTGGGTEPALAAGAR